MTSCNKGVVMNVVTSAMITIIAKHRRRDDAEVAADVEDHQFHQPACVHEDADGGPFAPAQAAGAGCER